MGTTMFDEQHFTRPATVLGPRTLSQRGRAIPIAEIARIVAKSFGYGISDLRRRDRTKGVALARHVAWWVARRVTGASFSKLGRVLGGRDHTTVMAGVARIDRLLAEDPDSWSPVLAGLVEEVDRIPSRAPPAPEVQP